MLKGIAHRDLLEAIRRDHAGMKYLPAPVLKSLAEHPPSSELTPVNSRSCA